MRADEVLRGVRLMAYRAQASLPAHRRHVERARAAAEDWASRCASPYISVSGGKDSCAMVATLRGIVPDAPLVHVCSALCLPCNCEVAEALATWSERRFVRVVPERDPWEWIAGYPGDISEQANNAASELDRLFFFEPLMAYVAEAGHDGVAMGLRAQESAGRRMNRRIRGLVYQRGDLLACQPLADWRTEDVFAAIVASGSPLSPIYGMEGLTDDQMIREGWWLPGRTAACGSAVWLRQFYPAIWRRLLEVRPELSALA